MNIFKINPAKTALLIVDMQRGLVSQDSPLVKTLTQQGDSEYFVHRIRQIVAPNIRKLLHVFRRNKLKVVFMTLGSEAGDFSDLSVRWQREVKHCIENGLEIVFPRVGTEGHRIIKELMPLDGDILINKVTVSAFNGSDIDLIMKNLGVKILIITGQGTDACVESTVRDASDLGYDCILVDDACAAASERAHRASLRALEPRQCRVETTNNLINQINQELEVYT